MVSNKLNFEWVDTVYNGGSHYISDNYKVIQYGEKWFAFYAVNVCRDGSYQFGSSCFHNKMGTSQIYKTREEAMQACDKHLQLDKKPWDYVVK